MPLFPPQQGHHLWQAGRVLAHYLEQNAPSLLQTRTVLELGAGAGLPSLIAALSSATKIVVTDYPDADLIENLDWNVQNALPEDARERISAQGFLWGADPEPLLAKLPDSGAGQRGGFDTLILADLLFNHSEHSKLLQTVQQTLRKPTTSAINSNPREPPPQALVFFTPYRPWLLKNDIAFFEEARGCGFRVEKVFETVMEKVMFEEDRGDEGLRRTVFGYSLTWADKGEEGEGVA